MKATEAGWWYNAFEQDVSFQPTWSEWTPEYHPSTDTSGRTVCPAVGCANPIGEKCDAKPHCANHQERRHE